MQDTTNQLITDFNIPVETNILSHCIISTDINTHIENTCNNSANELIPKVDIPIKANIDYVIENADCFYQNRLIDELCTVTNNTFLIDDKIPVKSHSSKEFTTHNNIHYRMMASKNSYQGSYKKVLCVCIAGLLRSPTASYVLSQEPYNYNTRSAGMDETVALTIVDKVLLEWCDEVVCMDQNQKYKLMKMTNKPVHNLNIPDIYSYRSEDLISLIKCRYDYVTYSYKELQKMYENDCYDIPRDFEYGTTNNNTQNIVKEINEYNKNTFKMFVDPNTHINENENCYYNNIDLNYSDLNISEENGNDCDTDDEMLAILKSL